jgi:hypothetical protein
MFRTLISLFLLSALAGCATALESTTEVTKPRVLGTVIRVQGDVGRATPAPGETVEVELVVADPGPRTGRSFVFVVCAPADTQFDVGACESIVAGPFIGALPAENDPKPAPAFSFTVPDEATLGEATELRVLGGVCADGEIDFAFDPDAFQGGATTANPCADQTKEGRLVTFAVALERTPEDRNLIPQIATITLDEMPWTVVAGEDEPVEGCAGGLLPQLAHTPFALPIDMTLTDGSREAFVNDRDPPEDEVEEPFVAFHTTAGDYKGAYSFFDDTPNMPTLTWTMPPASTIPDTGLLVRHWFVLRDGRGGSSFIERAVCIVP